MTSVFTIILTIFHHTRQTILSINICINVLYHSSYMIILDSKLALEFTGQSKVNHLEIFLNGVNIMVKLITRLDIGFG